MTALGRIRLGEVEAQILRFFFIFRKAHQQKLCACGTGEKSAVQKTAHRFGKSLRGRLVCLWRGLQPDIFPCAETDPLCQFIGILRHLVRTLIRLFFIKGIGQAFCVAVSLLILQKDRIGVAKDREESDTAPHRADLLPAEAVIDQDRACRTGGRCTQNGISSCGNAVRGVFHRHTAMPVFFEPRQRHPGLHGPRIPFMCPQRNILCPEQQNTYCPKDLSFHLRGQICGILRKLIHLLPALIRLPVCIYISRPSGTVFRTLHCGRTGFCACSHSLSLIPHFICGAECAEQESGKSFLFFGQGDHHLGGPGRQDPVASGIPEYMQAEIIPCPPLLYRASGQKDLRIIPHHIPCFGPYDRTVAAALKLVAQEVPPGCSPGRIFLGKIQKHPGGTPVAGLPVDSAQEADHAPPQLRIFQPAAGIEILPVAVGSFLLPCKPGGKVAGLIGSRIPDRNASQFSLRLRILAAQDQQMHAVQAGDQIAMAAQSDLVDQSVRLQEPVVRKFLFQTKIHVQTHHLQLQQFHFFSLSPAHLHC